VTSAPSGEASGDFGETYAVQAGDTMSGIPGFRAAAADALTAANPSSDPSPRRRARDPRASQ